MYLRSSLQKALDNVVTSHSEEIPLLINGETGTGKEILARKIHEQLGKRGKFVVLLCTCIPDNLFESELFGYKRGAFTGAVSDKEGIIEKANNGTLFIDEVSNLPLEIQSKFLGVLETKHFRRLGETIDRKSDFQLICATNVNLRRLRGSSEFREDLYFRIKGKILSLAPLREEPEEIFRLLRSFMEKLHKPYKLTLEAKEFLVHYKWPGNVRELRRFAEILIFGQSVGLDDLPMDFFEIDFFERCEIIGTRICDKVQRFKKELIMENLRNGKNLAEIAAELGKSEIQTRRILKKLSIHFKNDNGNGPKYQN